MFTGILQPTHLILLLAIALVVLGPKRLPDAGRALGQGLRELRNAVGGEHADDRHVPQTAAATPDETPPIR